MVDNFQEFADDSYLDFYDDPTTEYLYSAVRQQMVHDMIATKRYIFLKELKNVYRQNQ